MSEPRWTELEKLAKAATPGKRSWHWRMDDKDAPGSVCVDAETGRARAIYMCPRYGKDQFPADADFAVAANPDAVLELLAALAAAGVREKALREALVGVVARVTAGCSGVTVASNDNHEKPPRGSKLTHRCDMIRTLQSALAEAPRTPPETT